MLSILRFVMYCSISFFLFFVACCLLLPSIARCVVCFAVAAIGGGVYLIAICIVPSSSTLLVSLPLIHRLVTHPSLPPFFAI